MGYNMPGDCGAYGYGSQQSPSFYESDEPLELYQDEYPRGVYWEAEAKDADDAKRIAHKRLKEIYGDDVGIEYGDQCFWPVVNGERVDDDPEFIYVSEPL